jgi:hypothetical protein
MPLFHKSVTMPCWLASRFLLKRLEYPRGSPAIYPGETSSAQTLENLSEDPVIDLLHQKFVTVRFRFVFLLPRGVNRFIFLFKSDLKGRRTASGLKPAVILDPEIIVIARSNEGEKDVIPLNYLEIHTDFYLEGARGIEPPPGFADRDNGFEVRVAPSTIAPEKNPLICNDQGKGKEKRS